MLEQIKKEILPHSEECCNSDWKKIFDAMQYIFELSETARREGILVLEDGLDEMEDKSLQFFLRMVVDGMAAEIIEENIVNLFLSNSPKNVEAFIFLFDAYGALYIQNGNNTDTIIQLFQSLVPFSFHDKVYYEGSRKYKMKKAKIEKALKDGTLSELIDFVPTEDDFSKAVMAASDDDLEIMLEQLYLYNHRDCDWKAAIKYSTFQVIERFLKDEDIGYIIRIIDSINSEHTKEESDNSKKIILETFADIEHKKELVSQGKANEAFEIAPIYDDFAKTLAELSDEQLKVLVEKVDKNDWEYALKNIPGEVINRVVADMDFYTVFKLLRYMGRDYIWSKEIKKSKKRILSILEEMKNYKGGALC